MAWALLAIDKKNFSHKSFYFEFISLLHILFIRLTKWFLCRCRKLFVGGLSWETTQENLQRFFQRYGEVIDCVVMKNNESGRSRGFGLY